MELLSNSRQLRWLSCSFMLGLVTPCSLACLSNPSAETLQHLSLLDHQLGMCGFELFVCKCVNAAENPIGLSYFRSFTPLLNFPQVPSSHPQSWIVFLIFIPWLWISLIWHLSFVACWHLHAELHCIDFLCFSMAQPWSLNLWMGQLLRMIGRHW